MKKKRINKTRRITLFLLAMCCISGCLTEIALEVPEQNSEKIAIQAVLMATDTPYVEVRIFKVSDFRKFEIPEPVSEATVMLSDESGKQLQATMQQEGIYRREIPEAGNEFEIEDGRSYQLSVTTAAGKTYRSIFETLLPAPAPTGVDILVEQKDVLNETGNIEQQQFVRFLIDTPLKDPDWGGRINLRWHFLGTYRFTESVINTPIPSHPRTCYFFEDLNLEQVVVHNGMESRNDVLTDFLLLEEPLDYRFYEGYYLSIFQQSLSANAYQYWKQIGNLVDQSGSFFETQPGKIKGNFYNVDDASEEVFGYFYATRETVLRYYIKPGTFRLARLCPTSIEPSDFSVPYTCRNCLARPNSTLEKPDFWEE